MPVPEKGRTMRGPDSVTANPNGASPFGVMDLVGNMWQSTDEFVDEHSRGGILRGGSFLDPSETRPYAVTGNNRFRHTIHPSALSLLEVAPVNHLRSRSAKSPDRFGATEVMA